MGYYSLSMIISMSLAPILAIVVMNNFQFNIVAVVSIILGAIAILSLQLVTFRRKSKLEIKNTQKEKIIVLNDLLWQNYLIKKDMQ